MTWPPPPENFDLLCGLPRPVWIKSANDEAWAGQAPGVVSSRVGTQEDGEGSHEQA